MLRSYRGIILALVGVALIGAGEPPKGGAQSDQSKEQREIAESLKAIGTALQKANEPDGTTEPCDPKKPNRNSDLCAQWKAADAATDSAQWSWWQTLLAGGGLVVGLATFGAAVAAAIFAHKAAVETEKGAKAALGAVAETQEANRIARAAAALQLRPYVFFGNNEETQRPRQFARDEYIAFAFKNYGQTPALNVTIEISSDIVKRPIENHQVPLRGQSEAYGMLGPGSEVTDKIRLDDIDPADIAQIAAGDVLLTRMRISYDFPGGGSDFHDVTLVLSRDGMREGIFGLISKAERQRTE